ncbi:MAG TPA: hypothetical protein VJ691_09980 [Vicinamibacterales bacterium]|nr:hypothetical protein [Vicinamibacterales bacterium]
MNKIWVAAFVCSLSLHSSSVLVALAADEGRAENYGTIAQLQQLTDDLRTRMQIIERVVVTVVDHNPLVMSVETLGGRSGPFVITADREFISSLQSDELQAALAHELGHVWIYTHHPYVQTERMANDIALRVTSADVLLPLYEKVWKRLGIRGNLADYMTLPEGQ